MSSTTSKAIIIHPVSGEVLELETATTTDVAEALARLGDLYNDLAAFKTRLVDEIAGRMDKANARTETVGNYKIEVNAPRTEAYPVPTMRQALQELVDAGALEASVLDRVITTPEPKEPEPRVELREVNKLKRHGDPRVQAAIARVRDVQPARRTAKITRLEDQA